VQPAGPVRGGLSRPVSAGIRDAASGSAPIEEQERRTHMALMTSLLITERAGLSVDRTRIAALIVSGVLLRCLVMPGPGTASRRRHRWPAAGRCELGGEIALGGLPRVRKPPRPRRPPPLPGQAPSGRELRHLLSQPPYHRGQVADGVRRVADLDLRERERHCHPRVTRAHHRTAGRARHPGVASLVVLAVARTCVVLRWLVTVRAFPAARTAPEASIPDPPRPAYGRFADRDGALATRQSASRLA